MSIYAGTIIVPPERREENLKIPSRNFRLLASYAINANYLITLEGFRDAEWASDLGNSRSTSGFCFFLGSNLKSWQSKRQQVLSRSSIEVEYTSLAHLVAELTLISSFLSELKVPISKHPTIWCDKFSIVMLSADPI